MARPSFGDLESSARRKVRDALVAARDRALGIVARDVGRAGDPTEFDRFLALQRKQELDRVLADLERELTAPLTTAVRDAAQLAAADTVRAVPGGVGASIRVDPAVVAYAQETAADLVTKITGNMRNGLRAAITQSVAGGASQTELLARVREVMGKDASLARAQTIVRNELLKAYHQQDAANDEVLADAGVDMIKRWNNLPGIPESQGGRRRDEHEAIDGQERELDGLFNVGGGADAGTPPGSVGHRANAPRDPSLPPEHSINCGCYVTRHPRDEARQPYIRKAKQGAAR